VVLLCAHNPATCNNIKLSLQETLGHYGFTVCVGLLVGGVLVIETCCQGDANGFVNFDIWLLDGQVS
jgi:hypothetical protein